MSEKKTSCLLWPFVALWVMIAAFVKLTGRLIAVLIGLVLMLVGVILSVTVILAPIGIPLALFGLLLTIRGLW